MRTRFSAPLTLLGLPLLAVATSAQITYKAEVVADGFTSPVMVARPLAEPSRLFVAELKGVVEMVVDGVVQPTPFLDIDAKVDSTHMTGLNGFIFHPEYQSNGWFYVQYSVSPGHVRLERYTVPDPFSYVVDMNSATTMLDVTDTITFAPGGAMAFLPDRTLLVGIGDRRAEVEEDNCTSQSGDTLVGKILRLTGSGVAPTDNPFYGDPNFLDEIWAMGVRQPFRFSLDTGTGDLYLGDVGEDQREEITRVPFGVMGANLGYRRMEGNLCTTSVACAAIACPNPGFVPPLHDYTHNVGCAAIGGHVYRGTDIPELEGAYLWSDWCQGSVWVTRNDGVQFTEMVDVAPWLGVNVDAVTSYAYIHDEMYIIDGGGISSPDGQIFRLVRRSLSVDEPEISISGGGTQNLELWAGEERAGSIYAVLGSLTGTNPGTPLGAVHLPLNIDEYTLFTLTNAGTPPLTATVGTLDAAGEASASITFPPGSNPGLAGLHLDHAFVALDPVTLALEFASDVTGLDILP